MTYTHEQIREMLNEWQKEEHRKKWIEEDEFSPSDAGNYDDAYFGGNDDGRTSAARELLPIIRELLEEVENLKLSLNETLDMEDANVHHSIETERELKAELQRLQGEVERLEKQNLQLKNEPYQGEVLGCAYKDRCKEIERLQSQLAKYERSIKDVLQLLGTPTMSYCPTQEIQELADIRYKASKQLQEALKQLENPK